MNSPKYFANCGPEVVLLAGAGERNYRPAVEDVEARLPQFGLQKIAHVGLHENDSGLGRGALAQRFHQEGKITEDGRLFLATV